MDYEKKYKEALEKARQLCAYPTTKSFISDLQDLFPELAESEDEKVIKEIIELVMQPTWKTEEEFHRRNVLCAWLENVPVTIDHEKREGFHLGYKACLEKQAAEWSEEDEAFLDDILCKLKHYLILNKDEIDWLKSIKERIGGKV